MTSTHFEVLAHPYQQRVLVTLLHGDEPIRVPDGLRYRAAGSTDVALRLQHVDLPKLAEAGFVQWDRDANTVSRGPDFEEIRPLLETLADEGLLSIPEELPSD